MCNSFTNCTLYLHPDASREKTCAIQMYHDYMVSYHLLKGCVHTASTLVGPAFEGTCVYSLQLVNAAFTCHMFQRDNVLDNELPLLTIIAAFSHLNVAS